MAKVNLLNRERITVSPQRITRLRLGDAEFSLPNRITRVRLGDTVSSLQNRITEPYLRLGDTLDLRSCYTRQGDFISRVYHRVSPERITRLGLGDTGCDRVCSLQNRITKPYLRLGDTLQLRSGYMRQGDFSK